MKIAIYPGTFDPITYGHIDIVERASTIFDKLYLVIGVNSNKTNMFSPEEKLDMIQNSLKYIENCEVILHNGLTVDIAKQLGASSIIRGVRAVSDFDYEFQIALVNRKLAPEVHTLFMTPHEKYSYLSSSIVRELARYKQDLTSFVPPNVAEKIIHKFC